ncbi:NAD(P)-dependent dehydrogenase (short-subunit alcohol dehydrogenase family) [Actinocorallia herbida]|uniref:NAD(P)-dependent dehydrogenase (Short-subunit alcohol dehydrogenase family) n=1 Tax=Actinocorallia herbida TaxID=58109 RepID=A0A3N1D1J0_9ACTN|nr:SDR family oxidoreductase [Actinocorallia herbida]ROO87391.1 NAD(P)-dependent dehydrogenase (short-subunit alcohol dehydrogenase family) [Actinocorallia herbida]
MSDKVIVTVGVGGMGEAITRRVGSGARVLLADYDQELLARVHADLEGDGYDVTTAVVDVSSHASVADLAQVAAGLGPVTQLIHTAGVSAAKSSAAAILAVDLAGVAYSVEEFGKVIAPGGSGIVIASMAGTLGEPQLTPEREKALRVIPADDLLSLPFLNSDLVEFPTHAYVVSKRANQLRMAAAALDWGRRGARINSISPGIISTPQGRDELAGEAGASMRAMIDGSPAGRMGTPGDIAAAAAFLLGPDAAFITGTDLLVDGGAVAAIRLSAARSAHRG